MIFLFYKKNLGNGPFELQADVQLKWIESKRQYQDSWLAISSETFDRLHSDSEHHIQQWDERPTAAGGFVDWGWSAFPLSQTLALLAAFGVRRVQVAPLIREVFQVAYSGAVFVGQRVESAALHDLLRVGASISSEAEIDENIYLGGGN